jgi:hypothetical protein
MAAQCTVKSIECEGQEKVLARKHSTTYVLKKMAQLYLDLHVFYTKTHLDIVETSLKEGVTVVSSLESA